LDTNWLLVLAEGAEAAGEHAPTLQLFPDPYTIIFTMVNFAVLLFGLYKMLYKPLLGAISAREQEIEGALKHAAEDRAAAEQLRKDFEAQIGNVQREAQEIIAKATRQATATKEQLETEARTKAAEMLENATKTIEREKNKALAELREEVASLAVMVAGKVIEKNLNTDEHKRLAESFVAEVGNH
jgi:F-type H+-transporting ATPase subunit b